MSQINHRMCRIPCYNRYVKRPFANVTSVLLVVLVYVLDVPANSCSNVVLLCSLSVAVMLVLVPANAMKIDFSLSRSKAHFPKKL